MISLHILDVKPFMAKLLLNDTFDHFLLNEAVITTFNTFQIDGSLTQDYYNTEELENMHLTGLDYSYWMQVKPFCFQMIKGKRIPANFKIVFQLAPQNVDRLLEQTKPPFLAEEINGLYLNLKFDGKSLYCTTGTSIRVFTLDKTLEHSWDSMIQKFLHQKEIAFEIL